MTRRRETLPFGLALASSVALHLAGLLLVPAALPSRVRPRLETVVVDLLAPVRPDPLRAPPAAPQERSDASAQAAPAEPLRKGAPSKPASNAAPKVSQAALPRAQEAHGEEPRGKEARVEAPHPSSARELILSKPRGEERRSLDLVPKKRDLSALQPAAPPPDPAGGAREVTLSLDQNDPRYRAYRDRVWSRIHSSWYVGSGLLVTGGPKRVRLSFTVRRDGNLDGEVEVLQSTGNATLDQRAVDAVRRGEFPGFPEAWTIERLRLIAEFEYLPQ